MDGVELVDGIGNGGTGNVDLIGGRIEGYGHVAVALEHEVIVERGAVVAVPFCLLNVALDEADDLYLIETAVVLNVLNGDGVCAVSLLGHDVGIGIGTPAGGNKVVGAGDDEYIFRNRRICLDRLGGSGSLGGLRSGRSVSGLHSGGSVSGDLALALGRVGCGDIHNGRLAGGLGDGGTAGHRVLPGPAVQILGLNNTGGIGSRELSGLVGRDVGSVDDERRLGRLAEIEVGQLAVEVAGLGDLVVIELLGGVVGHRLAWPCGSVGVSLVLTVGLLVVYPYVEGTLPGGLLGGVEPDVNAGTIVLELLVLVNVGFLCTVAAGSGQRQGDGFVVVIVGTDLDRHTVGEADGSGIVEAIGAARRVLETELNGEGLALEVTALYRAGSTGSGLACVNNGDTGGTDSAGHGAVGNSEVRAGHHVGVGAVRHAGAGYARVSGAAGAVDDNDTLAASLYVSVAAGGTELLALTDKEVVELVDLCDRGALVGSVRGSLAHARVAGTCEIERGSVFSGSDHRPCLGDDVVRETGGIPDVDAGLTLEGIVGFSPEHDVLGRLSADVAGSGSAACVFAVDSSQGSVACLVVGEGIDVLGVAGIAAAGTGSVQNLTVDVEALAGVLLGVVVLRSIGDSRPVLRSVGTVVGSLDVLGGVETEAVNTAVDALLEQSSNLVLRLGVVGVEIRAAVEVTLNDLLYVSVIRLETVVTEIGGLCVIHGGFVDLDVVTQRVGVGLDLGTHVVGYDINNDLDTVLVSLGAK